MDCEDDKFERLNYEDDKLELVNCEEDKEELNFDQVNSSADVCANVNFEAHEGIPAQLGCRSDNGQDSLEGKHRAVSPSEFRYEGE